MSGVRNEIKSSSTFEGITSIDQITPFAKKPGGTRNGYIGCSESGDVYMVKIEQGGYNVSVAGGPFEVAGIESFSAQLIRDVWGTDYTTDIRTAKFSDQGEETIELEVDPSLLEKYHQLNLHPIDEQSFSAETEHPYAVVVPYDQGVMEFGKWYNQFQFLTDEQFDRLIEIQTIAKILGIDDYKFANMLIDDNNQIKLIDCAATFQISNISSTLMQDLFNPQYLQINLSDQSLPKEIVLGIAQKLISYPNEKLTNLLNQYEDVLSQETREMLQTAIIDLRSTLKDQLEATMQPLTSTAAMFKNLNISPADTLSTEFSETQTLSNQGEIKQTPDVKPEHNKENYSQNSPSPDLEEAETEQETKRHSI